VAKPNITASEVLQARVKIYEAVIRTSSQFGIQKGEVPKIAEDIWDNIIKKLAVTDKAYGDIPPYTPGDTL
jgi:hypothetical protein